MFLAFLGILQRCQEKPIIIITMKKYKIIHYLCLVGAIFLAGLIISELYSSEVDFLKVSFLLTWQFILLGALFLYAKPNDQK